MTSCFKRITPVLPVLLFFRVNKQILRYYVRVSYIPLRLLSLRSLL